MSLKESPSVLSLAISGAKHYLRPFGIYITGHIRQAEWVQIKAQHAEFGPVVLFVSLDAANPEYILSSVLDAYAERIYVTKEEASRRVLA